MLIRQLPGTRYKARLLLLVARHPKLYVPREGTSFFLPLATYQCLKAFAMVAEQHTEELPSEASPLLNNPSANPDASNVSVSFGRGFTIVSTMGLLLFIQGRHIANPVISVKEIHG
jgi:hypothetical protein